MMNLILNIALASIAQPPNNQLPPPIPEPTVPAQPPTLEQFSKNFKPQGGVFEMTVIHPCSNKPVNFVFKLPDGSPKVNCSKRAIEFDYGNVNVEIVFRIGGRVGVEYRN